MNWAFNVLILILGICGYVATWQHNVTLMVMLFVLTFFAQLAKGSDS
jgi:hypothetical protein